MIGPVLMKFGTPAQRAHFLPRIITLEDWWCQGYSEPGAGSDLASLKTSARREGESYVINGQKTWTTLAQFADWMFCLVRTRSDGQTAGRHLLRAHRHEVPGRARAAHSYAGSRRRRERGVSRRGADPGRPIWWATRIEAGASLNFCSATSAPISPESACASGCSQASKIMPGGKRSTGVRCIDDVRFRDRIVKLEIELLSHEWSLMRLISRGASRRADRGRGIDAQDSRLGDTTGFGRASHGDCRPIRAAVRRRGTRTRLYRRDRRRNRT